MNYPKIPLAQTIVTLCKAKNIKHIIVSPGSRNAPLTIGFTNDPFFTCYSIVDERCAGFFALGIAQQSLEPVALVCTSGSALLNYYPAVSEAFYSQRPLVVISADRPRYLVGIGDGQTINQEKVFENHILYSANLKQDLKEKTQSKPEDMLPIMKSIENKLENYLGLQQSIQQKNELEINKAINTAIHDQGPVHINAPFNEPLYDIIKTLEVDPTVIAIEKEEEEEIDIAGFSKKWQASSRKIVVVGVHTPNIVEQQFLELLAADKTVIVLTETTSNLHHDGFFPSIDKLIAPLSASELEALKPEILLTFGGLIVSKKLKSFLRQYQPVEHWHLGNDKPLDTFFVLREHFNMPINQFFSKFLKPTHSDTSNYNSHWRNLMQNRREKHASYLHSIPFTDLKAFDIILKSIPDHSVLQVGNSSAIRYTQLFDMNKTLKVFCNRGTSGIDGSTSTAIGAAVIAKSPTVLITGDLSFFYDSNGLWNKYIPNDFRIIVLNNEGGGIFRILPGHKNTANFETFFETTHQLNASHLCAMYGITYKKAKSESELKAEFLDFYKQNSGPKLLEIFTPRLENDRVLLDYFKAIK